VYVCVSCGERARESARKCERENASVGVSTYVGMREEGKREGVCVCVRACICAFVRERERERVQESVRERVDE